MRKIKVEARVLVEIHLNEEEPISQAETSFRETIASGFELSFESYEKLRVDDVRVEDITQRH